MTTACLLFYDLNQSRVVVLLHPVLVEFDYAATLEYSNQSTDFSESRLFIGMLCKDEAVYSPAAMSCLFGLLL